MVCFVCEERVAELALLANSGWCSWYCASLEPPNYALSHMVDETI